MDDILTKNKSDISICGEKFILWVEIFRRYLQTWCRLYCFFTHNSNTLPAAMIILFSPSQKDRIDQ